MGVPYARRGGNRAGYSRRGRERNNEQKDMGMGRGPLTWGTRIWGQGWGHKIAGYGVWQMSWGHRAWGARGGVGVETREHEMPQPELDRSLVRIQAPLLPTLDLLRVGPSSRTSNGFLPPTAAMSIIRMQKQFWRSVSQKNEAARPVLCSDKSQFQLGSRAN